MTLQTSVAKSAEYGFVLLLLALFSGLFWQFLAPSPDAGQDPHRILRQSILVACYGIAFVLVVKRWRTTLLAVIKELSILLIVLLSILSSIWSETPGDSLSAGIALAGTTICGAYFGLKFTLTQQLCLLFTTMAIAAVICIVFVLFLPEYGIMSGILEGAWRGPLLHKNSLGNLMVLGLVSAVLLSRISNNSRYFIGILFGLFLLILVQTVSKSSLGIAIVFAGLLLLIGVYVKKRDLILTAVITLLVAATALTSYLVTFDLPATATTAVDQSAVEGGSSKLTELTGRVALWQHTTDRISERPIAGHGFNATWRKDNAFARELPAKIFWNPPHAHNGYLDLLLDSGVIGLIIFATGFLRNSVAALRFTNQHNTPEQYWPLAFLAILGMANLTESMLVAQNSLSWFLYVSVAVGLYSVHGSGTST